MRVRVAITAAVAVAILTPVAASGPVGLYGIVERVVFEPDQARAERAQVWGAFMYADARGTDVSNAARGYLYFALPTFAPGDLNEEIAAVRREWADLKAAAGTGQAVAFGQWGYIGGFAALRPDAPSTNGPYILARAPHGGTMADMRVRPASEPPVSPAVYQTNTGIVRLPERGSHADVVQALRAALRR